MKRAAVVVLLGAVFIPLAATVMQLPPVGNPNNPSYTHIIPRYLDKGPEEAGAANIVTDVILNYRGYDTTGEVTVIFAALAGVLAVLLPFKKPDRTTGEKEAVPASKVVTFVVGIIAPFIAVFAIYLVIHGSRTPGGGFQGGTIFGALIILISLILGRRVGQKILPGRIRSWLHPAAVLAFILAGLLGMFAFGTYLQFPAPESPAWIREAWILFLEAGIGVGGAAIITSLFWRMES